MLVCMQARVNVGVDVVFVGVARSWPPPLQVELVWWSFLSVL